MTATGAISLSVIRSNEKEDAVRLKPFQELHCEKSNRMSTQTADVLKVRPSKKMFGITHDLQGQRSSLNQRPSKSASVFPKGKRSMSCASHLVMAGVDLVTVGEMMRHKSIDMTLRYSHLSPSYKKAAVEALGNVLAAEAENESKTA